LSCATTNTITNYINCRMMLSAPNLLGFRNSYIV